MVTETESSSVLGGCEGTMHTAVVKQEEVVEIALAAAGSALLASFAKGLLLPYTPPIPRFMPPSPLLFLLLHLVVACIAFVSVGDPTRSTGRPAPDEGSKGGTEHGQRRRRREGGASYSSDETRSNGRRTGSATPVTGGAETGEQVRRVRRQTMLVQEDGAEEVDARAEAFIAAFRRQLVFDAATASAGCRRRHSFHY